MNNKITTVLLAHIIPQYGPVPEDGKMGFRQMQWTHFRYRNIQVWELEK